MDGHAQNPSATLLGENVAREKTTYLKSGYSPEQVAGALAAVHPYQSSLRVYETIYTAIYAMQRGALRTEIIGWYGLVMPSAGRASRLASSIPQNCLHRTLSTSSSITMLFLHLELETAV